MYVEYGSESLLAILLKETHWISWTGKTKWKMDVDAYMRAIIYMTHGTQSVNASYCTFISVEYWLRLNAFPQNAYKNKHGKWSLVGFISDVSSHISYHSFSSIALFGMAPSPNNLFIFLQCLNMRRMYYYLSFITSHVVRECALYVWNAANSNTIHTNMHSNELNESNKKP